MEVTPRSIVPWVWNAVEIPKGVFVRSCAGGTFVERGRAWGDGRELDVGRRGFRVFYSCARVGIERGLEDE